MTEEKIKALVDLINKEPSSRLQEVLVKVIKANPRLFGRFLAKHYGAQRAVLPRCVSEAMSCVKRENLARHFAWFFDRRSPALADGLLLVSRFLNPRESDEDILKNFNALKEHILEELEPAMDTFQCAACFEQVFFKDFNFQLEALSSDDRILSLPDIVKRRKVTPFGMAVMYLLLAQSADIEAKIVDIGGKPVVIFGGEKDGVEEVYIDISARGCFVSQSECHFYAASRAVKWDASLMKALSSKQIVKRLLNNLIFIYSKAQNAGKTFGIEDLRACADADKSPLYYLRIYLKSFKE